MSETDTANSNQYGQPIGEPLPDWQGAKRPDRDIITGKYCRLEPLTADEHGNDLYEAFALDTEGKLWTYLPYGPFAEFADYQAWLREQQTRNDPLFYTVVDTKTNRAVGLASYLRIDPPNGAIEVGHLSFSPLLQRTPISTETQFLLMQYAFDELGYRRYEWKCDALNAASCKAAKRLGLQFEGIFRQAVVYKNRNRDTAWFAVIDKDWARLKSRFTTWLSDDNFAADGTQKKRLEDC